METQMVQTQKIEQFLKEMGVEFVKENNRILVKGSVEFVSIIRNGVSEIAIISGNTKVAFSYHMDTNRLIAENGEKVRDLLLPKHINVEYDFPYLEIIL